MSFKRVCQSVPALTSRQYREKKRWEQEILTFDNELLQKDIDSLIKRLDLTKGDNKLLSEAVSTLVKEINDLQQ